MMEIVPYRDAAALYITGYSDYRLVDGIRVPFTATVTLPILGRVVFAYESMSIEKLIDP